ncbi:LPS-assembly protein LptD [Parachlamydia sp. AcF125]|uniref:LPS-assembly protein LptD n=1 Tax=Parachlamydia sp. AcF125 TaxID=2795736 RepID=UPI001BC8ECE8|nr:LPS-assembly protein LptD [Parachlamydia sp. AcF125]MBS4168811.1 hypothetical protein [Parachlamydia sp. AcF125]
MCTYLRCHLKNFKWLKIYPFLVGLFVFLSGNCLFAEKEEKLTNELFEQRITVDLRSPSFSDGVLHTDQGGIIQGRDIRIQAKEITYTKKKTICFLNAKDSVMLELGDYVFVGSHLEFDFQTNSGVIYGARTGIEPWYLGGKKIELCSDGSYIIHQGFVTTSENYTPEWQISSDEASLTDQRNVSAKNVYFSFVKMPLFWLPTFKINLNTILDNPIRYNVRWGGRQGPRIGMTYEVFSWNNFKTFFRVDYRIRRGPGAGFETYYRSPDHRTQFQSISYLARDSSLLHPSEKIRYRFQGVYRTSVLDDKVTIDLTYDKLSDKEMAADYQDKSLELETALRTKLHVRRQHERWITNFFTIVRLNGFQTLKQELPAIETSWRPFLISPAGVITDIHFTASYLDFVYATPNKWNAPNYHSSRAAYTQRFYRSWKVGIFNISPEIGGKLIYYGNSPQKDDKLLTFGNFGFNTHTKFERLYENFKHIIQPYAQYRYLTSPTVSPNDHYIFDIDDGWYRLNMLRFGINQSLYCKEKRGGLQRPIFADLYAYAFFNTPTLSKTIPKVYAQIRCTSFETLRHILVTSWDFERQQLDEFNFHTDWTINQNVAFACEYRHRSACHWRKVNHANFILDSFHKEASLKNSSLSDRRDTLLLHLFYRFHPCWSVEFQSRHGWHRMKEPSYNEFEIDLNTIIRSCWHVQLAYRHKEDDDRLALYLTIGMKRPDTSGKKSFWPSLEF